MTKSSFPLRTSLWASFFRISNVPLCAVTANRHGRPHSTVVKDKLLWSKSPAWNLVSQIDCQHYLGRYLFPH